MRILTIAATALVLSLPAAPAAYAQASGASPGGTVAEQPAAKSPRTRAARTSKEPTAGQMAARERQRKCGAEWREAKAGGKTGGQKWPQFWSRCNARLKGNSA